MKLNDPGRQKLEKKVEGHISYQEMKPKNLYSDLLQAQNWEP